MFFGDLFYAKGMGFKEIRGAIALRQSLERQSAMGGDRRYRQDLRLPTQMIEGKAVIVVPAKSEMHVLDEVGTFIWTELHRPHSEEELARSVCEEFEVGLEQADRDVHAFLETLVGKGLLIHE